MGHRRPTYADDVILRIMDEAFDENTPEPVRRQKMDVLKIRAQLYMVETLRGMCIMLAIIIGGLIAILFK